MADVPKTPLHAVAAMDVKASPLGTPPVKLWEQEQQQPGLFAPPPQPQQYNFEYVSTEGARAVAAVLGPSRSKASGGDSSSGSAARTEASVVLSTAAVAAVLELFDAIDGNNDGTLTSEDFDELASDADFGAEGWARLQARFDLDGDGLVTKDEFVCVLKGLGLRKVLNAQLEFTAPARWTLVQWCNELSELVSIAVQNECAALRGWFEQYDGIKSAMRGATTAADRAEEGKHSLVATMDTDTESTAQMKTLFHVVDKHSRGVLEAVDFATLSKNPATGFWWREVKMHFDGFAVEKLVSTEFKARIVGAVHHRSPVGMRPAETTTWGEMVAMLREWGDWRVQTLCLAIFDARLHGEYGAEMDTATQELRDTFGPADPLTFTFPQ